MFFSELLKSGFYMPKSSANFALSPGVSTIMNSKSQPRRIGWKISLFQTPLLRNLSSGMMRRMVLLLPHWLRTLYTKAPGFLPKWTIPSFVVNGNHGNVEILSMKKKFMLIRIWEQLDWNFGQYMRVPFSTTFWFVILGTMPKGKPWNCKRFWWKSLKHEENGRRHTRSRKLQITFALKELPTSIYDGKPKEGWGQWSWNVYKASERKQRYEMKKFRSHLFSQSWVQHASAGCIWCKKWWKVLERLKIQKAFVLQVFKQLPSILWTIPKCGSRIQILIHLLLLACVATCQNQRVLSVSHQPLICGIFRFDREMSKANSMEWAEAVGSDGSTTRCCDLTANSCRFGRMLIAVCFMGSFADVHNDTYTWRDTHIIWYMWNILD